jgi:hypothetical protein
MKEPERKDNPDKILPAIGEYDQGYGHHGEGRELHQCPGKPLVDNGAPGAFGMAAKGCGDEKH